ncbi:hypothetical protein [Actinocrispum wychmicini]|uniref:hypothetical protein n=1 Tax=Actinocrispum wychmicini TaxID=1213861 RepID=UPI00104E29B6|nr:hypothetical protein [Actinocrispum wychmicini]
MLIGEEALPGELGTSTHPATSTMEGNTVFIDRSTTLFRSVGSYLGMPFRLNPAKGNYCVIFIRSQRFGATSPPVSSTFEVVAPE